jgi:hypothetical protein
MTLVSVDFIQTSDTVARIGNQNVAQGFSPASRPPSQPKDPRHV